MISPVIGTALWYRPNRADSEVRANDPVKPMAAMVTYAHNDRCVNLVVFDHYGLQFARQSVLLMQGDEAFEPRHSYCERMAA